MFPNHKRHSQPIRVRRESLASSCLSSSSSITSYSYSYSYSYTYTYTRMRMEQDHEKLEVSRVALDFAAWVYTVYRTLIERGNLVREQGIVYVYVYE